MVMDQSALAEVVKLALNHGHSSTRVVRTLEEATAALTEWRPDLAILDMDIAGSAVLDQIRARTRPAGRLPVVALTRLGDRTSDGHDIQ